MNCVSATAKSCAWKRSATAVPAISRRLEELPPDAHAIVVVQLSDDTPLQDLRNSARVETRRVATGDDLVAAIGELSLPAGEGYAWCAGEASMMARLRAIMVSNGHPREAMRVASYWKRGASDYHDETRR
ncbi:MAG: siderophore-interacting protein [Burkholderiaceae bacterium]